MTRIIAITLSVLLGVAFNSYAIEPTSTNANDNQEVVVPSDGWELVSNWRNLSEGMTYDEVIKTLGVPHGVNGGGGGGVFTWYYQNGGEAVFHYSRLKRWEEPKE